MKKQNIVLLIALLGNTIISDAFAVADTNAVKNMDYHCLSLCKNGGGATDQCISQCSYVDTTKVKSKRPKTKKDAHKQFNDLHLETNILPPKPRTTLPEPGTDYVCINQCLQSQMAYQYCQNHCLNQDSAAARAR